MYSTFFKEINNLWIYLIFVKSVKRICLHKSVKRIHLRTFYIEIRENVNSFKIKKNTISVLSLIIGFKKFLLSFRLGFRLLRLWFSIWIYSLFMKGLW